MTSQVAINTSVQSKEQLNRFLSRPEVEQLTSLKRSTIYKRIDSGLFPKSIKLGARRVAWLERDIQNWIASCLS